MSRSQAFAIKVVPPVADEMDLVENGAVRTEEGVLFHGALFGVAGANME